ncbi:MAG: hypothetical protein OEP95_05890 [Myxococcales bacterium]|nr:hypothetical protein [Myxococcales bacterium]
MDRERSRTARVAALLVALLLGPAPAFGQGADGRFSERRSSHFVLRQDVALDQYHGAGGALEFERMVLDVLEAGHDALEAEYGLRAPGLLEVSVWDPALFDQRFAGLFRFPAAGFYGGTIHVRGAVAVTNPLRRTLHHELVHASLDAAAPSLALPAWLNEGLSEWFESRTAGARGRLSPQAWAALEHAGRAGALPSLAQLGSRSLSQLDPARASLAYFYSHGVVDHVARRRGGDVLRRLVRELVRTGDVQRAFRKAARGTPQEFEVAFRRELGVR